MTEQGTAGSRASWERQKEGPPPETHHRRGYTNEDGQLYRPVYTAVENVIVDDFGVLNVGLSDEVTEAVLTVVIGWLAERDRQVAERAWNEGAISRQCVCHAESVYECGCGMYPSDLNPHRKEAAND